MSDYDDEVELEARARELLARARAAYRRAFDARSLDGLHALVRLAVAEGDYREARFALGHAVGYRRDDPDGPLVSIAPPPSCRAIRSRTSPSCSPGVSRSPSSPIRKALSRTSPPRATVPWTGRARICKSCWRS